MSERSALCSNCEFWDKAGLQKQLLRIGRLAPTENNYQHSGYCRRYPPTGNITTDIAYFPIIEDNEWCGEWKPV